jgi:hypothetical protein
MKITPEFLEKIKTFLKKLDDHSSWNSLPMSDRIQFGNEGIAIFKAAQFQGTAFRVISETSVVGVKENFNIKAASEAGTCWSHSVRGCEHFLADIVIGDGHDQFSGIMIEAEIVGFSLYAWLKEYKKFSEELNLPVVPMWVRESEEEIILTELISVNQIKNFDFDSHRENNLRIL